jgi:hypothetical protein
MADPPPAIPREISSDGREVWAWGHALSEWTHRQQKKRELYADLRDLPSRCGSCDNWMKSRECPREHNVNGRNRGPSMNAPICPKFIIKPSTAELIARKRAELDAMLAEESQPPP